MKSIAELIPPLPYTAFGDAYELPLSGWPRVPPEVTIDGLAVDIQQRYALCGLMDNIYFNVTPSAATQLGQWILACNYYSEFEQYTLHISDPASRVRRICLEFPLPSRLDVTLKGFTWTPQPVDEYVGEELRLHPADRPLLYVTNERKEWFTMDELWARDRVVLDGDVRAHGVMAEFFLNFGHPDSNVNYEFLKYHYAADILAPESCEARAVLATAERSGFMLKKVWDA